MHGQRENSIPTTKFAGGGGIKMIIMKINNLTTRWQNVAYSTCASRESRTHNGYILFICDLSVLTFGRVHVPGLSR